MDTLPQAPAFDVFLSHSSGDKPAVEAIASLLRQAGTRPWLDAWELVPGADWEPALANAMRDSQACAYFIGPANAGDWAGQERQLAQNRAARDPSFRLIPVLLPGLPEPFDFSRLPPFLTLKTWVDFRAGLDDERAFGRLLAGIHGVSPGQGDASDQSPAGHEPYRGLEVFDEAHAGLFFGREAEIQRIVEQIKESGFLAVLGASGSGKSSLVRAGLVSALRSGALPASEHWPIRIVRPRATPLTELAAELVRSGGRGTVSAYVSAMLASERGLYQESLALLGSSATAVVWIVDQFEEIYSLCNDDVERRAFIDNLLHASSMNHAQVRVVVSMRADFYFRCATHPQLAARMSANQFLLGPMTTDSLRAVIERPAAAAGHVFEPGLVDAILDDVARQPGALPLLAYALFELWQRRDASRRKLTFSAYQAIGGVAGALTTRADDVYDKLSETQRAIARQILLRLTQPGDGTEDTRRAARFDELVTSEAQRQDVEETVRRLVEARLLTTSGAA